MLDPEGVDVLLVAGDVGTLGTLGNVIPWLCKKYPHVVYVLGNHEFYGSNRPRVLKQMGILKASCPNLHWLDCGIVEIKGQRFLGTPLWFPDLPGNILVKHGLNDFSQIRGYEEWVYAENTRAIQFLQEHLQKGDVVVTHHIPSQAGNSPQFKNSALNPFFVCDVSELILDRKPKLWVYGHTHDQLDLKLGKTRLVCNAFGYFQFREHIGFDNKKVIKV